VKSEGEHESSDRRQRRDLERRRGRVASAVLTADCEQVGGALGAVVDVEERDADQNHEVGADHDGPFEGREDPAAGKGDRHVGDEGDGGQDEDQSDSEHEGAVAGPHEHSSQQPDEAGGGHELPGSAVWSSSPASQACDHEENADEQLFAYGVQRTSIDDGRPRGGGHQGEGQGGQPDL